MDAETVWCGQRTARVAFIAGTSWSGSTLLEQGLAQLDGCVSVGELYWLWNRDWPSMVCECGQEFRSCEFWQTVVAEAFGKDFDSVRTEIRARSDGLLRHSIVPTLAQSHSKFRPHAAFAELGAMVEPVYRAVESVSDASTIVDSSKCGLWGLALNATDEIDLRVVHLVRDPLGFVASDGRRREVPYPVGATRPPRPASRSLITWLLLNVEAEYLTRHVRDQTIVLYEDLVRAPSTIALRVANAVGIDTNGRRPFVDDTLTVRRTGHAIGGNPRRPKLGATVIARGDETMAPQSRVDRLLHRSLVPVWSHYRRHARSAARTRARASHPSANGPLTSS